jgi:class 3 adenylate cyclase/dienelactone hydrolase
VAALTFDKTRTYRHCNFYLCFLFNLFFRSFEEKIKFLKQLKKTNPDTMSSSRQLAAILFADIQGYTALMQDDEGKATSFREKLKKNLDKEVLQHNGRILKLSGDGALCSFNSAIEAVRAAIGIQKAMMEEPKVPLRIGIHLGDVMFEEGDVHGDGVNAASRIESFAVPEAVFISGKVFDEIRNQKDIQTVSLGKYLLKNVKEPVEIFAVSNAGLQVPSNKKLEGKGIKYSEYTSSKNLKSNVLKIGLPLLAICIAGFLLIPPWLKKQNARNVLLPAIQRSVDENFRPSTEAFDMALEAEKYIPDDSALIKLWPALSTAVSFETIPTGAKVFWKDYDKPDADWRFAGTAPLKEVRFPRGYLRMEIRKKGFQTIEYAGPGTYGKLGIELANLKLDPQGSLPENMVRIPMSKPDMYIVGLEQHGGKNVGEFLIDKYEVTNKAFKTFMDAGGYSNKSYWNYPVITNGKETSLDSALLLFTDRTGRQGPADWEAGTYPDGQENYPVTGISWYEASAYAAYIKKQLPTVFHWGVVAATSRTQFIVPLSNYNGKATVAAGSKPGYCSFGIYDLAGNVREWCFNESTNPGQRFILGGGWNDPTYSFNDSYTQSASDRGIANGFRCIKELPGDTTLTGMTEKVSVAFRDYRKEKPVDDKTFAFILNQYAYDKKPLNAKTERTIEGEGWTAEKISFDAGYNNERLDIYVYLPKNFKPPFQPVLFFPGSGDIFSKQYDPQSINGRIDFILKSGRAIIRPIYKGTHERHDDLKSDLQDTTVFYKDHVIMWRKEIGRTIDFLETRTDMQADKVGFLGWSWGGFLGGIIPAVEKRIKVVVLNVGGMEMHKALPEADQINFLPRITQPVLMLNGKHDMYFPVETSQKPMFDLLGTPKENKKIIIYESGHLVPRTNFVKETLLWYDKYLGNVK